MNTSTKPTKDKARVKTGTTVNIMRGSFKGKQGKVNRVDTGRCRIYIDGITVARRDGQETPVAIHISNVRIREAK